MTAAGGEPVAPVAPRAERGGDESLFGADVPGRRGPERLRLRDWLLLAGFCALLFGFGMFDGRPLSLHEARLPVCSQEMLASHNWLFPQSGGRPWLERPPLPQWVEVAVSVLLGRHCDKVWVVRLPAALAALSVVGMTAWIASVWFGRSVALLAGLVLATTYEFYAYAVLAEDDIFLAAAVVLAVALFVSAELRPGRAPDRRVGLFGNRPWQVWALFLTLGLSNLIKGPLVGAAVVIPPIAVFLLSGFQKSRSPGEAPRSGSWSAYRPDVTGIRRYAWFWGGLIFLLLTFAWSWAAHRRYPDISRNLFYDYQGTADFDHGVWYYPAFLIGLGVPWIVFAPVGLAATFRDALAERRSAERFLWCWALVPMVVLSIPHRKHHHYMLPSLAPWAILGALGVAEVWRRLRRQVRSVRHALAEVLAFGLAPALALIAFQAAAPGRLKLPVPTPAVMLLAAGWLAVVAAYFYGLFRHSGAVTAAACFAGVGAAYCWGQWNLPDMTTEDTRFLARVSASVPPDQPLFVNADLHGEMDFFRNQFYLGPRARLLHNLTFLRDRDITAPQVWVVARYEDRDPLREMGRVEVKDQSVSTRRENDLSKKNHRPPVEYRFTLFRLQFRPDLRRYPRPAYIGTLQAMGRERGPYCGPPPPAPDPPPAANATTAGDGRPVPARD